MRAQPAKLARFQAQREAEWTEWVKQLMDVGGDEADPREFMKNFRTDLFDMTVTVNADGGWSYFQDTVMQIMGQDAPFHHTDHNTLTKVAEPTPNPLMRG